MKAECELVQHEWDGIIRALVNREYDAIMSSLEITERRQKRIAFSDPYYRIPAVFIGSKETAPGAVTPAAMAGKKIGTIDRSDHEAYLKTFYKDSEIVLYAKPEEANLDLLVGRIDAVFGGQAAAVEIPRQPRGRLLPHRRRRAGGARLSARILRHRPAQGGRGAARAVQPRHRAGEGGRHLRPHPRQVFFLRHQVERSITCTFGRPVGISTLGRHLRQETHRLKTGPLFRAMR